MTETFSYCPAPGVGVRRVPRLIIVPYGDGYRHRITTGINIMEDLVSVTFNGHQDYIQEIDTFLKNNFLGGFYFPFISPDPLNPLLFTCDTWQLTWMDRGVDSKLLGSLQAEFALAHNFQPVA